MEPLNTFFRISPGLLNQIVSTPRSGTSSSFSSPSFADHQTGLKVYRDSPPSLSSAHQVVDDNPLFEGFPVLPPGARNNRGADGNTRTAEPQAGHASKLQEQLHHLLTILQHALELHNADGLPEGLAPRLADELEAMAKKLKEKEREAPVERQLRTKVQMALTGAEATIRKLRATPRKSPGGSPALGWRCNDAADSSPTCSAATRKGRGGAVAAAATAGARCRSSMRDSVCKQLLQSPSSSMSPLSWAGPAAVTCSPLFGVDDADMASPKELPAEQQWNLQQQAASDGDTQHDQLPSVPAALRVQQCAPAKVGKAAEYQPPLYSWMKAVLASASKQDEASPSTSNAVPGGATAAALAQLQSPEEAGPSGEPGGGLAAAVRAALTSTRMPPLVYGSPLHRRIQRLLAEQRSPSPLRHVGAQADGSQCAGDQAEERGLLDSAPADLHGDQEPSSAGSSRGTWGRPIEAESPGGSVPYTDTTSSCDTPVTANQDVLSALPFRSSVSPFGPTLRERYGAKVAPPEHSTADSPTSTARTPEGPAGARELDSARQQQQKQAEAAELVAQLGLDLQLDPDTAGTISELEVLEHVERWAREQYIAAQRALLASVGPNARGRDSESIDGAGASLQALVDIAIQTESPEAHSGTHPLRRSSHAPEVRDAAVGTVPTPRPASGAVPAPSNIQDKQQSSRLAEKALSRNLYGVVSEDDDGFSDICSPARSDQAKRSPAKSPSRWLGATAQPASKHGHQDEPTPQGAAAGTHCARKRHPAAEFGSTPARRGLFRTQSPAPVNEAATSVPGRHRPDTADDLGRSAGDAGAAAIPGPSSLAQPPPQPAASVTDPSVGGPSAREQSGGTPLASQVSCRPCSSGNGPASKQYSLHARPADGSISKPGPLSTPTSRSATSTSSQARNTAAGEQGRAGRSSPQSAAEVGDAAPEVLLTPGSSHTAGNAGSAGRHASRVFPSAPTDAPGGDVSRQESSLRGLTAACSNRVLETQFEEELVRSPGASDHAPAAPQASGRSGCDEFAPEVLFTPGNSLPGGKSAPRGKRKSRVFRPDGEVDGESVVHSVRTLSSISSVSIIASEAEGAVQGGSEQRQESRAGALREPGAAGKGNKARGGKPSLSRSIFGLLMSIATCAHVKA